MSEILEIFPSTLWALQYLGGWSHNVFIIFYAKNPHTFLSVEDLNWPYSLDIVASNLVGIALSIQCIFKRAQCRGPFCKQVNWYSPFYPSPLGSSSLPLQWYRLGRRWSFGGLRLGWYHFYIYRLGLCDFLYSLILFCIYFVLFYGGPFRHL